MSGFAAALKAGSPILMDGAMGTEIARVGPNIAEGDWVAVNLGTPDLVSRIHRDYARAGARLHIANSFATGRQVLEQVGMPGRFEALNREAVRLCRDAVEPETDGPFWIAGSVSTYMVGSDRSLLPPPEALQRNARDQARLLAEEGCDLIVLEMLFDVDVTLALYEGAAETGLPVSIGYTCELGDDGTARVRGWGADGAPFGAVLIGLLERLTGRDGVIMSVMHSLPVATDAGLDVVRQHWDGPVCVYPNAGRHVRGVGWQGGEDYMPADFTEDCRKWRDRGVDILGGCCGVGSAHIQALREIL